MARTNQPAKKKPADSQTPAVTEPELLDVTASAVAQAGAVKNPENHPIRRLSRGQED